MSSSATELSVLAELPALLESVFCLNQLSFGRCKPSVNCRSSEKVDFFFVVEFTGVTQVRKTTQVSNVQVSPTLGD